MIKGIVTAVPKNRVEVKDAKFKAATGVAEHRAVVAGQDTLTLALAASKRLLNAVEWAPADLSAIICVTQSAPARMPAMACAVAGHLGARCAAFDVNLACSGYPYGLVLASVFGGRHTLLITGDTVTSMVAQGDAANGRLFGDAVAATAVHDGKFINVRLGTDGEGFDKLKAAPFIEMDGPAVFNFALQTVPKLIADTTMNGFYDWLFLHQANGALLKNIVRKAGLDKKKVPSNIWKYGNTSSASIPLVMCDSDATAALKTKNNRVAMAGFGAGWSYSGLMLDLEPLKVAEVLEVE